MTTARSITRQRLASLAAQRERLPIECQVAHAICGLIYPSDGCACERSPDKPTCERMVGIGRHIVDTVRRHDRKQAEAAHG